MFSQDVCGFEYMGCIKSASAVENRLGKALSCHLTESSKDSSCIINKFYDLISKSFINKYFNYPQV